MIDFLKTIILLPTFWVGWIVGWFARSFIRGYFYGFYYEESTARNKVIDELQSEIDKIESENKNV